MRPSKILVAGFLAGFLVVFFALLSPTPAATRAGVHKIRHVVIIMQENRSFDSYFGAFPGANGIRPGLCAPDPVSHTCRRPYHDRSLYNTGGPHHIADAVADANGAKMNGFVIQAQHAQRCQDIPQNCDTDVMGYHTAREIPNYWAYARRFVLQDRMFEPTGDWSLPQHLYMVSGWSAHCTVPGDPFSCTEGDAQKYIVGQPKPDYAWTDLTYLLNRHHVSWAYYVTRGGQPDCANGAVFCGRPRQNSRTPGVWNPLLLFDTVRENGQLGNVKDLAQFFRAAHRSKLPAVSWIVPNQQVSEHPSSSIRNGEAHITEIINAIMRSRDWRSTAIFLSWDDWGGFYDHVAPPRINGNDYGFRVPGLVISPYAKKGFVDHRTLSHDAYNKFIEDIFLGGQRLDPNTDGRPDPRTVVREILPHIGDLRNDFNFHQRPRPPLLLPPYPRPKRHPGHHRGHRHPGHHRGHHR